MIKDNRINPKWFFVLQKKAKDYILKTLKTENIIYVEQKISHSIVYETVLINGQYYLMALHKDGRINIYQHKYLVGV